MCLSLLNLPNFVNFTWVIMSFDRQIAGLNDFDSFIRAICGCNCNSFAFSQSYECSTWNIWSAMGINVFPASIPWCAMR